ncbi:MAG: tetratricopeptide repeat protein [Nitrososphaeria archaeon]
MEKIGVIATSGNEFELHPLVRDVAYSQLQNAEEMHKRAGMFYYRKGSSGDKLESLYHFIMGGEDEMAIEVLSNFASFVDEGYGDVLISMLDRLPATNNARLAAWLLLAEGSTMRLLSMGMETAKEKLVESIKSAEEAMDGRARALAMNNLGIIYRELGEIKRAKEMYREAMRVKGLDPLVISRITYNLAEADLEEGELSSALRGMKKSMKIDLKYHEMRGYYVSRLNIDYVRFLLGQFDGLLEDLMDVAEKLKKLGLKSLLGYCYLHMAYTVIGMYSSPEEALEYLNLALEQYALSGFKYMQVYTLAEMIIIKAKMKKIDDATSDMREVEKILGTIEDRDVLGSVELARAVMLMASGNFSESEVHLNRSLELLSRDWVSSIRVNAWRSVLYGLSRDNRAQGLLTEVQKQLEQNGCNVLAERFSRCSRQLKDGSWETLCGFLI